MSICRLQRQSERAVGLLRKSWPRRLAHVDVYFVSEACIAQLHWDFMKISGATDVITFQHGEIFVCPAVAERQRRALFPRLSLHDEILTYIIHGFLHLCGWNDYSPQEFSRMKRKQESILRKAIH